MWRSAVMARLVRLSGPLGAIRAQTVLYSLSTIVQDRTPIQKIATSSGMNQYLSEPISKRQIGENVSRKDKINFLVKILMNLDNSQESVYNALDSWVAWEQDFPIGPLRRALIELEKEHQWHRVIQVIKWMLSKGQGTTIGTYGQLVRALDMDHRAEEAHEVWEKKLGSDLHSVPWQQCHQIISVYYRNNMLERLVKLFEGLEAYDRKPRDKKVVKKVGDAYEVLGMIEKKERVLEKYKSLFDETSSSSKKSTRTSIKR
ncbi:pentatricopeptide repeat-containing protein At4g21190-like [Cynara cardunculus var. scolymus]|uniref:pentatricopeptide repeat-containing protein At4g21190-like n=1 Tax=Cynara cardunculus var. scolymus TaxID=59895 RepID=UPI000D6251BB|nr:pentatricopeptide repeat-containing protein At4g21190-like [Cynara cardunculus var. scolymus]